jgi:hypothetical protein
MMKGSFALAALLVLGTANFAAAQQPADAEHQGVVEQAEQVVAQSGLEAALDSVVSVTGPQLQGTLEQLMFSLNLIALRVASDPELRNSVKETGEGLAALAQNVVKEQSTTIAEVLRAAAERIEDVTKETEPDSEPK